MIVITGASSGLGAALAKRYYQDHQSLVITGRNQQRLQAVADTLIHDTNATSSLQTTNRLTCVAADLCDATSVSQLMDAAESQFNGKPKMVIHCAGSGYFGPIESQSTTNIQQLINNNLITSILLVRELVKRYQDQPLTLVIVMSTAALAAKAGESTYCAVKWAVRGLIESVRLELKNQPMKIIAVYPGGMDTDFWPSSGKNLDTSSFMSADEAASMLKQALLATEHGYIADLTIQRG